MQEWKSARAAAAGLLMLMAVAGFCREIAAAPMPLIHSVEFFDASRGLPGETAADVEKAKTFDPGAPCPGLPGSASHLVKAGIYKAMDCLVQGDRFEYWQDDLNGQFLVILPPRRKDAPKAPLRITLFRVAKDEVLVLSRTLDAPFNKASFLINMSALVAGEYVVRAGFVETVGGATTPIGEEAEYRFRKSDKKNPVVPVPADGIPIVLERQEALRDVAWPVRAGVPLPINAVTDVDRLALFENGRRVPAKVTSRATWCPKGSAKWTHVDFTARYAGGKAADYRLKLLPNPTPAPATRLRWKQTDDRITIDTGAVQFEVSRKGFAGIEKAWVDLEGEGNYNVAQPAIDGRGGPYLVDGRMIRFEAAADDKAEVIIEEASPTRVTVRAEGWYQNGERRVKPICRFQTRITAFAGSPMLRVVQSTLVAYDTRMYQLRDLGFSLAVRGSEQGRLGADGKAYDQALTPKGVWLHQDRHDRFRLFGAKPKLGRNEDPFVHGKRSDGWFAVRGKQGGVEVAVFLRDIWQKFPKEVSLAPNGITLHFWPEHGHRAFPLEDELALNNIYKFWCFHQGPLLDLRLPNDYFAKFDNDYRGGTFECRPEHALNGNAQGAVISNEFAVLFSPAPADGKDDLTAMLGLDLGAFARLFQRDPAAAAPAEWNCATAALGRIAAADRKHFAEMEDAVEKGYLSHTKCVERGGEYGMWNYADTHTYFSPKEDRAQLHRVWHNSHYHEMGMTWMMYYRTGSPDLLRWARASTDHWMNVDTVNWADPAQPLKFHTPGAMYHCKGLTHWGGEAYGMQRRDGHAGLAGHWTDPDAFLWSWYLSGRPRAWDVYRLWARSYTRSPWHAGTRREANTTFANVMDYYLASWDANMLPAIRGQGVSLRTHEPLEKQYPGPMWHPLWMNRYYEHTRDPDYVPFILKYARRAQFADTWTTALSALAYELSGDKTYLTQHNERVHDYPRQFYRRPGDPYDWYGQGPGPLGSRWGAYFCWGHLRYAYQKAGITDVTPAKVTRFSYLVGGRPSLTVLAMEKKDAPFTLTFSATSLGGDLHRCQCRLASPSGKALAEFTVPPRGGPSTWTEEKQVPADGEAGVHRFEMSTHEASVRAPLSSLPFEAELVPKATPLATRGMYGLLRPAQEGAITLTFTSGKRGSGVGRACNIRVSDATGKLLLSDSLFLERGRAEAGLTLDPARHPLPWQVDVIGMVTLQWSGAPRMLLLGPTDEALRAIIDALPAR